jgi:hypothetical protein
MDKAEFIKLFCEIGLLRGFTKDFGCLLKESNQCIVILELQKSKYGNYYELNIKIFINGVFNKKYKKNKELKKDIGDVFSRPASTYRDVLDLDTPIDVEIRTGKLNSLFDDFIVPFTDKALTINGIKQLSENQQIILFSAVSKELEKLYEVNHTWGECISTEETRVPKTI